MTTSSSNTIAILLCSLCFSCGAQIPAQSISYVLTGGVQAEKAEIVFRSTLEGDHDLLLREDGKKETMKESSCKPTASDDYLYHWKVDGLKPGQKYHYEVTHRLSGSKKEGTFTTFPKESASFTFCFGSCMETGSESEIFDQIRAQKPLFFLQGGDIHYEDIDNNCAERFLEAYQRVFTSERQSRLYAETPLVYIWDDHDFGPNNADSSNPCRRESAQAYETHIPHYPTVLHEGEGPISQVFDAGRVTFVLTDLRSQKVRPQYTDCIKTATGTNFGSEAHLQWFFQTLLDARNRGQVIAWYNSYPWINASGGPNWKCAEKDNWGGYPEERERIANFIRDEQIPLFIMSGDAHMVAMDDGTNSDYATGGGAPIRVFQAAAIDRPGSYKGGPYSQGYSRESGQFGVVEVNDPGGSEICFAWYAINKAGKPVVNQEGNDIRLSFCLNIPQKRK